MANELAEGPDFGLRAGAQAVKLFRKFRGRARNFVAVTHINVLQETRKRRRRGLLALRCRDRCQGQDEKYSWNQSAHKWSSPDWQYTPHDGC